MVVEAAHALVASTTVLGASAPARWEGAQRNRLACPPPRRLSGLLEPQQSVGGPDRRTGPGASYPPGASAGPRRSATGRVRALCRHCGAGHREEAVLFKSWGPPRREDWRHLTVPFWDCAPGAGGVKRKWGFLSKQGPLSRARRRCRCGTREQERARLREPGLELLFLASPVFECLFPCQSMKILLESS